MNLRRALFIAAGILAAGGTAFAQFQPPPQQQPAQQQQGPPPCVQEFFRLRDVAEKKAGAIRAANERKANPKEACALFTSFVSSEAAMLKYAEDQATWCGIPADVIANIKKGHANSTAIKTKVCAVAAQPPRPAGPSLSDTLGGPVTTTDNIKTGRGTFDTLTGTPLGQK
jgi:hypothetical protein